MNIETVREWTKKIGEVQLFLSLLVYASGCVINERPLGPKATVAFIYHCTQFKYQSKEVADGRQGQNRKDRADAARE